MTPILYRDIVIPRIIFASCYVYSPTGAGTACELSRLLRTLLKDADPHFLGKYAARVRQQVADHAPLAGFFGPGQVLLPVPGSAPFGRLQTAERLAAALVDAGLGDAVWRGLTRSRAVRKSATAAPGTRPSVGTHIDSFAVVAATAVPSRVLLIDDVVTKGRTLLAAASRLHDAYPTLEIRAFALLRTLGLAQPVDRLLNPCVGEIRWRLGDAQRTP